jgi:hypothetical protein
MELRESAVEGDWEIAKEELYCAKTLMYAAVTVRLLSIRCQDTTNEDWES